MLRLTSDCYYLSKEKIEDVSSTVLFSLVIEYPYYQEGILIRKLWGNQFTYTFLTLSLPSSGVCEREKFSLPLPLFPAHCSCPAVVPLSRAVVPLGPVAHQLLLERLYRCLWAVVLPPCSAKARAVVPSMHRSSTALASGLMRFLGASGPVGPVVP